MTRSHQRMASLRVFVCLLGLVVLCHSECVFEEFENKDPNNPPTGCVEKDGTQHDFGSEWVRDCILCICSKEGLICCSKIPDTNEMHLPENCELLVNEQTCTSKAVLKSDKTKDCDHTTK